MRAFLDFTPALAFLAAYFIADDIFIATAVLIVASLLLVAFYRIVENRWHRQHVISAVLVAVLGGVTLAVHDSAFIKLKPTVLYALFAAILLGSQAIGDKVLLERLGGKTFRFPDFLWRRINLAWAFFFAGCAVLNLYVAHNFDEATWVKFKTLGFTALTFLFLLGHAPFVGRYIQAQEDNRESP